MKYEWLDVYCLSKKGAVKEYKAEWEVERFMLGGKMFLMHGSNNKGEEIVTLKLEPMFGEMLRGQYECIAPGYYMNKVHWNSVNVDGNVPDDLLKEMIDKSYELIFASLSKKERDKISVLPK